MKKILITGGAGFIGSFVAKLAIEKGFHIINVDNLSYAGSKFNIKSITKHPNHTFIKANITNKKMITSIYNKHKPHYVMHLAASSHVDNSIKNPKDFIKDNIQGTYNLLQVSYEYYKKLKKKHLFKFHYISTDEVYGSLGKKNLFNEKSNYLPNNPYSASKASGELLVRSWNKTFGLPTIITNCSNNYGPFQHSEKLIPVVILNALSNKKIPVYGNGNNIRDWLYVEDHAEALLTVIIKGKIGSSYNIGDSNELTNIKIIKKICSILDLKFKKRKFFSKLIEYVDDRPGHDFRYAIDSAKIRKELKWKPKTKFEDGLNKTIDWYIKNKDYLLKKQKKGI